MQAQENWFFGVGPTLEINESLFGANIRAYYGPNEELCFGPEVSIFPFQQVNEEEEISLLDLNINAHYVFEIAHGLGVYPISGINYSIENIRFLESPEEEERIAAIGLNYGAGLHFNFNKIFLFAEYKGILSELTPLL